MRLCSKHAVEAGTKSSHKAGASTAACEALHVLAKQEDLVVLRHVHFAPGEEPEGWEAGILADHPRIKVDAVCRRASDGALVAYQYQGNRFHGFPPGNPLHETFGVGHQWGPALWNKTRRRTEQYIKGPHLGLDGTTRPEGYVVVEVWEHDYISYKQQVKAAPRGGEVSAPPTLAFTQHAHDPDLDMSEAAMASRDVPVDTMPAGDHVRSKQARECASLSALSAAGDGRVAVNLAVATGGPCPLCRQTNSAAKAAAKAEAASV